MKGTRLILILPLLFIVNRANAGDPVCWLTYSQSKYIFSPGIEACYLIRPYIGVNAGISLYIQEPDYSRVTNITHNTSSGFYNANLGLAANFLRLEDHSLGLIAGFKLYYGPDFRRLHYYEDGGYYIYYDASFLRPDYGLDLGIFYSYKQYSFLVKWDSARNRFRIGLGYRFERK
jgi:hypothetical protein